MNANDSTSSICRLVGWCLAAGLVAGGCNIDVEVPMFGGSDDAQSDAGDVDGGVGDVGPEADVADTSDAADVGPGQRRFELTDDPYTTLQRSWAPINPDDEAKEAIDGSELEVTDIEKFDDYGLGVEAVDGNDWVEHSELAPGYPGPIAGARRSLLYFWQSADPQIIDEESPVRFEGVTRAPVGSTYRPHDHLTTQIYAAHVRTIRRISAESGRRLDFAFVAGDFSDNGQRNEVNWALDILAGGRITPDSGETNDPVPGPANDYTDSFVSPGLSIPWYVAIGNHETLYVGTLPVTDSVQEAAVGTEVFEFKGRVPGSGVVDGLENGFRDASTRYAEVRREGPTPADEDRHILQPTALLEAIRAAPGRPSGHGFSQKAANEGRAYYSFKPLPGKPVRFIVLDTLMDDPAHVQGKISDEQFKWLKSELDAARRADELVIVGGHHRLSDFQVVSGADAEDIKDKLASYDNVLMYIVGHGHKNAFRAVDGTSGGRGFYELMCASTVDMPLQSRIFEIVYDGDGYLSVYVTNVGHNSVPGTLPHWGRELAAVRKLFFRGKDVRGSWKNQRKSSNLLLRYKLPSDVASRLEGESWPSRIESLETLDKLPVPEKP